MTPELIAEIVALITQLGPIGMTLFLKLEPLLHLGPDEKTNIANGITAANAADDDVHTLVIGWMKQNGMVAQFVPAPEAPPAQ